MCIRDSEAHYVVLDDGFRRHVAAGDVDRQVLLFLREQMEPVSYTHLRAHETVLDIVCRLLLEKTKFY